MPTISETSWGCLRLPWKGAEQLDSKTMPIHELESKKKIGSVKSQDLVDVVASAPAFDGLESFETLVFY